MHSPTSRGSQLCHSAQDKMMSKKPTARTKESRITAARCEQRRRRRGDDGGLTLETCGHGRNCASCVFGRVVLALPLHPSCVSKSATFARQTYILATVCTNDDDNVISHLMRSLGSAFVRNDAKVFRFCTSKYVFFHLLFL